MNAAHKRDDKVTITIDVTYSETATLADFLGVRAGDPLPPRGEWDSLLADAAADIIGAIPNECFGVTVEMPNPHHNPTGVEGTVPLFPEQEPAPVLRLVVSQ